MPTSHSSEAVEGITMHIPMCDIRGTLRSINLAHVPYITLGDGKGDLYLCLSYLVPIPLSGIALR